MLVGLVLSGMFLALLALTRRRTYGLTIAWGIAILSIAVSGLFGGIGDNFFALTPFTVMVSHHFRAWREHVHVVPDWL